MIEDEVFRRKRFIPEKMKSFGFQNVGEQYIYEVDFMNNEFHAILSVSEKGSIDGKVIDKMNDEEYAQLRSENFNGAYVNSVREAYRQLLESVSKEICEAVFFASGQANRITEEILNRFDVKPDFPWDEKTYQSYGVFRHENNRKWFALIMNVKRKTLLKNQDNTPIDIINVKSDTLEENVRQYAESIFPGYHMNHKTWISIILDDSLDDETVMSFVKQSYALTGDESPFVEMK